MSSINSASPLSCLPVELLEGVLSHLRTKELLRISTVSQRVYASVGYLVCQRFRNFESLDEHHLIFECSPPSGRRTTYHTCYHSGSYPISKSSSEAPRSPVKHHCTTFLSTNYSHFIPLPTGAGRYPPISAPPSVTYITEPVSRTLMFDTSAYFTQLMASSVLAKRVGMATSVINIFPETFFRIRRSWLRDVAKHGEKEGRILWLDDRENVGLRLRVVESGDRVQGTRPLSFQPEKFGEDQRATSFECVFSEFCIRTGYLVERAEEAKEKEKESKDCEAEELICMG